MSPSYRLRENDTQQLAAVVLFFAYQADDLCDVERSYKH